MNNNPRMRRLTDILMTLALLFLMGYQLWGETEHEWVGTAMGVLFIVHQWFNRRWYRTLRHGPWSLMRFFHAGVDLLAALAMLALLTSGAVLLPKGHTASHVFSVVRLTDYIGTAQIVHLAASHWLYILLALHIGFHGRLFCDQFLPKRVRAAKPKRTWAAVFFGTLFALYGATAFVARDFLEVLFLRVHFLFPDGTESVGRFYFDYMAIMVCFAFVAYGLQRLACRIRLGRR